MLFMIEKEFIETVKLGKCESEKMSLIKENEFIETANI
jgi:hypothetical protein